MNVQSRKGNDTFKNYANLFNYTSAGAVSSMRLGNGRWENMTFNSRLQPTQIGLGTSATNQSLLKLDYDYGTTDNNGNIKSQTITVPTVGSNQGFTAIQTYTYDSLNRIHDAKEMIGTTQTWKQTFQYDRYGNRRFDQANTTFPTFSNPNITNPTIDTTNNRFTSGQGYTYDLSGNLLTDAEGKSFVYDAENKQKSAATTSSTLGQYSYDGDGKRVKKLVPSTGETTIFVYDAGGKMVAEYSTITPTNPQISYLTNDHLGSPRIISNELGQVTSRRDFMPFGEEISSAQRTQNLGYTSDSIREKFATYERDKETDLDFAQARYFDSGFGRFSSPDPYNIIFEKEKGCDRKKKYRIFRKYINQPQNWNDYIYVLNNPLNFVDPLGLIYLKGANGTIYYVEDGTWADKESRKAIEAQIGKYTIVPTGTIITVGKEATGIFEPYRGKLVVLGDNGVLYEITQNDLELGTVHADYDPGIIPFRSIDTDANIENLPSNPHSEAEKAQQRNFGGAGRTDPARRVDPYNGGFRHCVATCLLVKRFGGQGAMVREIWDFHNESSGAGDSQSDMQAEDIGIFLSFMQGKCEELCSNAYPSVP